MSIFHTKMTSLVSDLLKMTGLQENDLALNGFFLDDVDIIIQSDRPLTYLKTYRDDDGGEYQVNEPYNETAWLVSQMEQMCSYTCVPFGDKYYYLVYHA